VINASPGNLAPVFDAILEKAHTLCGAAMGSLVLFDGTHFRAAATLGYPEEYDAVVRQAQLPTIRTQALISGERFAHVLDMQKVESELDHSVVARSRLSSTGIRTALWMPLRKDNNFLGFISAYRRKVEAFSQKEIALLENFAAQAVIAMENARLLNEQREALEQQTATAEVLQVINANPGNLTPVFDVILEKAIRLCNSAFGMLATYDGHIMRYVATHGLTPEQEAALSNRPLAAGQPTGRIGDGEDVVHLLDARDQDGYRSGFSPTRNFVDKVGARTAMWVALRKDKELLGLLTVFRREVRAFTDKEVALVQSFAVQAVIAMENARLLNEIRQRQEELRITFENMGDGVALFDETRHLVASNRRFQEMLDVPDNVISERPAFADYIRYLADRGEYGPDAEDHVQRLLSFGGQPTVFERTRPNGRVIEVRGNPVQGGGFVLIYADITERKRNEDVNEVQRILDLVRDARGQLAERRHLFSLDQAGLRCL
jgi:GAF domain-containing protein